MKIFPSKKKQQNIVSIPDNLRPIIMKKKSKKRVKNKKVTHLSQLVASLGDNNISYLDTACGTVKCIETLRPMPVASYETQSIEKFSRSTSSKEFKAKRCIKPRKRNSKWHNTEDKHQLTSSSPKLFVIKMTDNVKANKGPTILESCSNTIKSNSSGLTLLESLISTGIEESEGTNKGVNTEQIVGSRKRESIVKEKSKHSPTKTFKPSQPSSSNKLTNPIANESSNSPVCSIAVKVNGQNSVVTFYELGSSKFLVLMHPESSLFLVGAVEIKLLKGSIEVLGYNLQKNDEKILLYSLQGSSHLSIKAKDGNSLLSDQRSRSSVDIREKLTALGLPEVLSHKVAKKAKKSTLFTVARQNSDISTTVWPQFFEHHSSFFMFPSTQLLQDSSRPCHIVERKIQCLFESNLQELGLKAFNEVPEWSSIERDIMDIGNPKVILCGGKSVGKSSLLRYLVNKSLFKWKKIIVLDFDLGQCEFTVPGCISATLVEGPLLGPNYSHLQEPARSVFLGEVDVTKCPENYIEGCKSLIDYARATHPDIPWFVNTMGFTKGFGVSLACGIITYVRPTHVVQIQSKDRKLNFPSLLERKYVDCLKHSAFDIAGGGTDYHLYEAPSGSEQTGFISKSRGISPAESRNLVILSYMSKMLNWSTSSLSQVTPYMINMDKLELLTISKYNLTKNQVAATMNGNMVALCHEIPFNKFLDCRGFGIVRAIDWQNNMIFLITPLPPSELSKVNCLVKGNVALPDSLYYNQGTAVTGHVPYLAHTSGGSTARFAKRDFRNLPVTQRVGRQNR